MTEFHLAPTEENTFCIAYPDGRPAIFDRALEESWRQENDGDIEGACNTRYNAFFKLVNELPEDTETILDWEDPRSRNAMLLVSLSAIDHFLIGDFEMCAGMLELLLELDPEDHLEATRRLAYCYVALEEYELFDEVINDISDKHAEKCILRLWCDFRRNESISEGEYIHFRKNFGAFFTEFTAFEHPVSDTYLAEIARERPSKEALARELWLQTEHLWRLFPGFIEALRAHK